MGNRGIAIFLEIWWDLMAQGLSHVGKTHLAKGKPYLNKNWFEIMGDLMPHQHEPRDWQ
jgi:hypothetical protein